MRRVKSRWLARRAREDLGQEQPAARPASGSSRDRTPSAGHQYGHQERGPPAPALLPSYVGTLVAREGERRQSAEERAAELQALNSELQSVQRERERLAEEATRAIVLERIDEQRSALLRSVSHDLRTPLATIRAVASDLLGGASYDEATRALMCQGEWLKSF